MSHVSSGLRLVVYDATQRDRKPRGLGLSWQYGTQLYRALGRVDAAFGARDFREALAWLAGYRGAQPVAELQFWGHGKWGAIFVDRDVLDRSVLQPNHRLHAAFQGFRERLLPNALLWFRTCETLGAVPGQDFAQSLGDATGARVAGHTFVIGFLQSGLHCLQPGDRPSWPSNEGLAKGHPAAPEQALPSAPDAPNTITCLHGNIPEGFR